MPQDLGGAEVVLASNSAIRAELLRQAGIRVTVCGASVDELRIRSKAEAAGTPPDAIALSLAEAKARKVSQAHPDRMVLGCDQILLFAGRVLGKAADIREARAVLVQMRGETHRLISAATLVKNGKPLWRHAQAADLTMRDFDDAFLDRYMAAEGEEILPCVGCYRLEGLGIQLFERIEGEYFTVLGIPLLAVLAALRTFGGEMT